MTATGLSQKRVMKDIKTLRPCSFTAIKTPPISLGQQCQGHVLFPMILSIPLWCTAVYHNQLLSMLSSDWALLNMSSADQLRSVWLCDQVS